MKLVRKEVQPGFNLFKNLALITRLNRSYLIIIVLAAGYLCLSLILPKSFYTLDSDVKLLQTKALVESGWQSDGLADPAREIDPGGTLSPLRPEFAGYMYYQKNGQWHSIFSLSFALLGSVAYAIFGVQGTVLLSVVPAAGVLFLLVIAAKQLGLTKPYLPVLLVGLCSPLAIYAIEYWEHALGLFFALLAVVCCLSGNFQRPLNLFGGGLAASISILFRTEYYCLLPALALVLIFSAKTARIKTAILFGAGVVTGLIAEFLINLYQSGSLTGAHLAPVLQNGGHNNSLRDKIIHQINNAAWMLLPLQRFQKRYILVIALVALIGLIWWWRGKKVAIQAGLGLLLLSTLFVLLYGLLNHTNRYIYPTDLLTGGGVIILALLWLYFAKTAQASEVKEKTRRLFFIGLFFAAFIAVASPNSGAAQWGPRYLLLVYPILILLASAGLEQLFISPASNYKKVLLVLSALVLVGSAAVTAQGLKITAERHSYTGDTVAHLQALPKTVIVTDSWVLPYRAGLALENNPMLGVDSEATVLQAAKLLKEQGKNELVWISPVWLQDEPNEWTGSPVQPGLSRFLEKAGWVKVGQPTIDAQGFTYTNYKLEISR